MKVSIPSIINKEKGKRNVTVKKKDKMKSYSESKNVHEDNRMKTKCEN